jgi:membrane protease YdiL (CAAX protease family)
LTSETTGFAAKPAHWGLVGTVLWAVVIAAVFAVLQTATVIAAAVLAYPGGNLSQGMISAANNGTYIALATIVTGTACPPLIALIVKLKKGSDLKEYLGLKPVSFWTLFKWIGLLAVFIVLSDRLTEALGREAVTQFDHNMLTTAKPFWVLVVALTVAAPLVEEVFFRGFLLKGLVSTYLRPAGAVLLTSALFASMHAQYDLYGMATIFAVGLLLGTARLTTGSLFVPVVLHGLSNGLFILEVTVLK